jgi:PAS domain S-box-containing protein
MTPITDPFVGGGEVQRLARSLDWTATGLGPVETWPTTLRDTVRACLESPFPICLWCGPELTLIYNDGYTNILGAKHPASLGRPGAEVWSEIWPEIGPWFTSIREGGPPIFMEEAPFHVRRADGPAGSPARGGGDGNGGRSPNAWFTFSLSPVRDDDGDVVAFLNIVSETTRRVLAERAREEARAEAEAAEARLRDVFASAPAFMAVLRGPDHVFEYVNEAYHQLVGHRKLLGRPVFQALPEARAQGFVVLLDNVLATGEPFVGREMPISLLATQGRAPEERFLDFVYYPITEADGTRSGVVVHGSDVTDHVRARREAQLARAEAEQANLAKSQFLATMSHEIRTPINAAMGYADLLDAAVAGSLSPEQQSYVAGIRTSSRHLLGLVNDVLDLAKIEAGEVVVGVRDVEVRPVVESALRLVAPQANARGLALRERWEVAADVRASADGERVRQILLNLLSNAAKFTDPGGTITVRCRTAERPSPDAALPEMGPWLVIDVEDTGRGITVEQMARVFEPFVQAESGHTRQAGGTGLGLTISRRLARLMGGELTAQSEPGQGSRFSLWLPPMEQRPATEEGAADDGSGQGTSAGGQAGAASWLAGDPGPWPPPVDELPGLASAGRAILAVLDEIEAGWVDRLRSDRTIAAAQRVTRAQCADQTAELLAAIAKTLYILEEGGGDPGLLRDAEAVQGYIARRHGQQRRRLGWGRGELEREYQIMAEVLDEVLRREVPKRTAADLRNALAVVNRLLRRAVATSVAVYDGRRSGEAGRPDA